MLSRCSLTKLELSEKFVKSALLVGLALLILLPLSVLLLRLMIFAHVIAILPLLLSKGTVSLGRGEGRAEED